MRLKEKIRSALANQKQIVAKVEKLLSLCERPK